MVFIAYFLIGHCIHCHNAIYFPAQNRQLLTHGIAHLHSPGVQIPERCLASFGSLSGRVLVFLMAKLCVSSVDWSNGQTVYNSERMEIEVQTRAQSGHTRVES